MSTLIIQPGPPAAWQPPPVEPLNEKMWEAWEAKGRYEDRRIVAAQINAVKWIAIVALLAAAVIWTRLAPYEVVARFIVAIAAAAATVNAVSKRSYMWAIVFGAMVLLFNPVLPVFAFTGEWERALVVLCAVPFAVSLTRSKRKAEAHA